jgi:hypothetical protein
LGRNFSETFRIIALREYQPKTGQKDGKGAP